MQDSYSCIRGLTSYSKGIRGWFLAHIDLARHHCGDERRVKNTVHEYARILECQAQIRAFVVPHRTRRVFVDGSSLTSILPITAAEMSSVRKTPSTNFSRINECKTHIRAFVVPFVDSCHFFIALSRPVR
jgi:hypothetical protein